MTISLYNADCVEFLRSTPDCCLDAVVCDPPYGLEFMGKEFDSLGDGPGQQAWHLAWAREALRVLKPGGHLVAFGGSRTYHRLACAVEDAGFEIRDSLMWLYGSGFPKSLNIGDGRGTALKPAHEPVVLARKPLEGTVAANVQKWGVGALNIDGCRIASESRPLIKSKSESSKNAFGNGLNGSQAAGKTTLGRWPANVALDEEAGAMLGEPSRFFYCAKASRKERGNGNSHPTVKPVSLMRWLVRLVTPPGGVVLDPFMGSGSTGIAALLEGYKFVGIEREAPYFAIAQTRISAWERHKSAGNAVKALAVALVLAIGGPAYADDVPRIEPTPAADLCLSPTQQVALAKRLEALRVENEVLKAQPTPLSPWAFAGLMVAAVLVGGAAGYAVATLPQPAK